MDLDGADGPLASRVSRHPQGLAHARQADLALHDVEDALRVDVWRGEFSVGDSLVICARNLVDVVGTELRVTRGGPCAR